jgi:DNA-binding NtrC family response regulator
MEAIDKTDVLREVIIPLSTYSRSAYGVGFSLLRSPRDSGRCLCSLFTAGESEPDACAEYRRGLFGENGAILARCPAGLSMAVLPSPTGEGRGAVLLSDGFLAEGPVSREAGPEGADAGYAELLARRGEAIPKLSAGETDLLVQLMENAAVIYPLLKDAQGEDEVSAPTASVLGERGNEASLVGVSEGVAKIRDSLSTFAGSREPLLIESEQGNGRHLIAGLLHQLRPGLEGAFVCENLAVLPEALQEHELFGSKGDGGSGLIGHAAGGTLFLNAVENLTPSVQRLLLSHLSSPGGEDAKAGGNGKAPARIIVSTDRSLGDLVRKGRFRSDLHRRISRLTLFIPPLRERKDDIPLLVEHLLRRLARRNGHEPLSMSRETLLSLQEYSWPGNVRELQSELQRAAACGRQELDLGDFSPPVQHAARPPRATMTNIREAVGRLETEIISRTLAETKWNKSQAARILGLSRLGLQKKIDRYGLDRRR